MFVSLTIDTTMMLNYNETASSSHSIDIVLERELKGHTSKILASSLNMQGDVLATAAKENTVYLWQTKTGKVTHLQGHQLDIWDVRFCTNRVRCFFGVWWTHVRIHFLPLVLPTELLAFGTLPMASL